MGENPHEHHRQRLKARFQKHGLESFDSHQVLELLLFYAIPRKDTNELAHRLIDHFGSLTAVLEASTEELCRVEGIGEHSASLINLCGHLIKRYYTEKRDGAKSFSGVNEIGEFLVPLFMHDRNERAVVISLNSRWEMLGCDTISEGTVNATEAHTRTIVETALRRNATAIILAHNHPDGFALPSQADINITRRLAQSLQIVDVCLIDHILVSGGEFVSLRQTPHYAPMFSGRLEPTV